MNARFAKIIADSNVSSTNPSEFAIAIAEHVNELNAIHPFREGNGRTLQLFLTVMASKAGHRFDIGNVAPQEWIDASVHGFKMATSVRFKALIEKALQTP
jgi:cell filamentation protein